MKKGLKLSVLSPGNFSCDFLCSTQENRMVSCSHLDAVKCKIHRALGGFAP